MESELFGYERGAFTGAMSERVGKIELANGGTLFLDEVESMPLPMQAKLLRVLEERAIERLGGNRRVQVDMRVVAATNQDLGKLVREGTVREDFYYRINVVPITLPPLRERREDIPLLVAEFLRNNPLAREKGLNRLTERAVNQLMALRLAGQHPRAVERDGARRAARQGRHDQGGRRADQRQARRPARPGRRTTTCRCASSSRAPSASTSPSSSTSTRVASRRCARHASVDQATLHRKIKAHGLRAGDFRQNGRAH